MGNQTVSRSLSNFPQAALHSMLKREGHQCCREGGLPAPISPGKGAWHNMKIPIVCNGNRGYYLVHSSTCICCCVACMERAKRADLPCIQISPTEFERHSGIARDL